MTEENRDIIANIDRLHSLMAREGYAALILRSGKNFTYLAGFAFPGTLGRHLDFPDSPREVLLIWPQEGDPILVLNHIAAPIAERDSWIERIELYDGYTESPYDKTAQILTEMKLHKSKLGFEKSYLSAVRWEEVNSLLRDANISDCTRMMDEVRWIKTPSEVERLRQAAGILDTAYLEVFPTIREGDTEREVHGRIVRSCIQHGAQWAHGILNSSRNTVIYGGESDMRFRQGDIIRNDYVAYYLGYPGHQSRTAVLGQPSKEQRQTYEIMRDLYRTVVDQCRVGAKAGDVYQFANELYQKHGAGQRLAIVGHSVGPWWHQQDPHIVENAPHELEQGMVLALEPHVEYWHLQDMFLITGERPELLSDRFNTDEMFVIE